MATPTTVQTVCNSFVDQYYNILHTSPNFVFKFYQDSSTLGRPDPNGIMTSVTGMHGINDKIMSLNYNDMKVEIKTADAQESHEGGVIILVTGCVTGLDGVKLNFVHTFFLAPQENGYFVLNDIFRYIDAGEPKEPVSASADDLSVDGPAINASPNEDASLSLTSHVPVHSGSVSEDVKHNGDLVGLLSVENHAPQEESAAQGPTSQMEATSVVVDTDVREDVPKRSYASILRIMNEGTAKSAVKVTSPEANKQQALASIASSSKNVVSPATDAPAVKTTDVLVTKDSNDEGESHSIYISNLPLTLSASQLEEEFKKFGSIKPNGVQVRSKEGFCFGFVAFELSSSMQEALKASPVLIKGKQAFVEEKRGSSRGLGGSRNGRGRYPFARGGNYGGYQNDNFRGRSNYGYRSTYARDEYGSQGHEFLVNGYDHRGNDYGNRRDYGSRARGSFPRIGYHQNGRTGAPLNRGREANVAA